MKPLKGRPKLTGMAVLESLSVGDQYDAIDHIQFVTRRDVSEKMQHKVLNFFAGWQDKPVWFTAKKIAQILRVDEQTVRFAIQALHEAGRIFVFLEGRRRCVAVNWQRVHDEVANALSGTGESSGELELDSPDDTGEQCVFSPVEPGDLEQRSPADSGNSSPTDKSNLDQFKHSTPTTYDEEWEVMKRRLSSEFDVRRAHDVVKAAIVEGWTIGGLNQLLVAKRRPDPREIFNWIVRRDPNRPFGPEEGERQHQDRLHNHRPRERGVVDADEVASRIKKAINAYLRTPNVRLEKPYRNLVEARLFQLAGLDLQAVHEEQLKKRSVDADVDRLAHDLLQAAGIKPSRIPVESQPNPPGVQFVIGVDPLEDLVAEVAIDQPAVSTDKGDTSRKRATIARAIVDGPCEPMPSISCSGKLLQQLNPIRRA